VLADLISASDGLRLCVEAFHRLDLEAAPDSARRAYRFVRSSDRLVVDLLAPDHSPPKWPLRTIAGCDTIQVPGGRQSLGRPAVVTVVKGRRTARVPVPDLLGAVVLKTAAWLNDSRDRDRHSSDVAFLVSLIDDPRRERARFAGSDRRRLNLLDRVLGASDAHEWLGLGDHGADGFAAWRLLLA
jgi:hypothetical protein